MVNNIDILNTTYYPTRDYYIFERIARKISQKSVGFSSENISSSSEKIKTYQQHSLRRCSRSPAHSDRSTTIYPSLEKLYIAPSPTMSRATSQNRDAISRASSKTRDDDGDSSESYLHTKQVGTHCLLCRAETPLCSHSFCNKCNYSCFVCRPPAVPSESMQACCSSCKTSTIVSVKTCTHCNFIMCAPCAAKHKAAISRSLKTSVEFVSKRELACAEGANDSVASQLATNLDTLINAEAVAIQRIRDYFKVSCACFLFAQLLYWSHIFIFSTSRP